MTTEPSSSYPTSVQARAWRDEAHRIQEQARRLLEKFQESAPFLDGDRADPDAIRFAKDVSPRGRVPSNFQSRDAFRLAGSKYIAAAGARSHLHFIWTEFENALAMAKTDTGVSRKLRPVIDSLSTEPLDTDSLVWEGFLRDVKSSFPHLADGPDGLIAVCTPDKLSAGRAIAADKLEHDPIWSQLEEFHHTFNVKGAPKLALADAFSAALKKRLDNGMSQAFAALEEFRDAVIAYCYGADRLKELQTAESQWFAAARSAVPGLASAGDDKVTSVYFSVLTWAADNSTDHWDATYDNALKVEGGVYTVEQLHPHPDDFRTPTELSI